MSKPAFKLDPTLQGKWKAAIGELAFVMKKENPSGVQDLVKKSARRFVKNVADVTPPASGKADQAAKKKGELAILGDLLKIAVPTTVAGSSRAAREVLTSAEDLLAAHERARRGAAGRVNPRNRKDKLFVSQTTFNRTLTMLQRRVGWLAAGLNAAAEKLGFKLPAWIKRHGSRYGAITVQARASGIRIRIVQDVPFATDVKGYPRRWNFALAKEYKAIFAQAKIIWAKAEARARARAK